ncbi:TIGR03084 family metal-binding protein [Gordonia sp. MP11Mi]|uniref:Mycothiol-dependent maleylpyruvate isomerase metal-binding domain-containing protein n=1 Tax=Gordonia sp. MP11Mi TaxID=3022769 RepID=A0AA97D017_9ACTN
MNGSATSEESHQHVIAALREEGRILHSRMQSIDAVQWRTPTSSEGWSVAHQIAHLQSIDELVLATIGYSRSVRGDIGAVFDLVSNRTLLNGTAFAIGASVRGRGPLSMRFASVLDRLAEKGIYIPSDRLLEKWHSSHLACIDSLADISPDARLVWAGTSMAATTMATARLMETWAHGCDIVEALGSAPVASERLRYIADLGVRTRGYSYRINGIPSPVTPVRVELASPSGELWSWGPDDAPGYVTGSALDFCLVVVQRRQRADTTLTATSNEEQWLRIAQCFAGPPPRCRTPR